MAEAKKESEKKTVEVKKGGEKMTEVKKESEKKKDSVDLKSLVDAALEKKNGQSQLGHTTYMRDLAVRIIKNKGIEVFKRLGPTGFRDVCIYMFKVEKPELWEKVRKQVKMSTLKAEMQKAYYDAQE